MRKELLIWDSWNKNHIKKHKVTVKEIEEVYYSKTVENQSYLGRMILIGQTKKGRLLLIVISFAKQKEAYIVSARDAGKKERKYYYEKSKTN